MHQLLMRKRSIQVFPIHGRRVGVNYVYNDYTASKGGNNPTSLQLTYSEEGNLAEIPPPHFRRIATAVSNPPASPRLTCCSSFTLRAVHHPSSLCSESRGLERRGSDANMVGLDNIIDLDLPSNVRRYYIVVTPEDTDSDPRRTVRRTQKLIAPCIPLDARWLSRR